MRAPVKNTCNSFSDFRLSRGPKDIDTLRFGYLIWTN